MACFYSAFGLLILLTRGAKPFAANKVSPASAIAVYLISGPIAGALLGLLRPFTRHLPGAMLVSIPVSFPVFAGALLAVSGMPWTWDRGTWIMLLILTCAIGPFFGGILWYQNRRRRRAT